jgi:hypothetical protein
MSLIANPFPLPQFFCGLECVGHSFADVAHYIFFRGVWIRTQRAAVANRDTTNLATHLPCFSIMSTDIYPNSLFPPTIGLLSHTQVLRPHFLSELCLLINNKNPNPSHNWSTLSYTSAPPTHFCMNYVTNSKDPFPLRLWI